MPEIEILLATHNGRSYLAQQIDSILRQTFTDWRLLISDDASNDGTRELARAYAQAHPGRIRVIDGLPQRGGACRNFAHLLRHSSADYVAFCDQDDCWHPDKLAASLEMMRALEKVHGKDGPVLVHTDLQVVDEGGRVMTPSFWRRQHLDPVRGRRLSHLLVQNVVTGCTMLINARLRDLCRSIPSGAIMHDWWIALVAAVFGRIAHLPQATVCYRQHPGNAIGAPGWNCSFVFRRLCSPGTIRHSLQSTRRQAAVFMTHFAALLPARERRIIRFYAELEKENFFMRRIRICQFSFLKSGLLRNLAYLAMV
ncbi:MAG: glycosyltransferase family 2 protein [Desulfuromonadales bacterium]